MTFRKAQEKAVERSREQCETWLVVEVEDQDRTHFEAWTPDRWDIDQRCGQFGVEICASWTGGVADE